MSHTLLILKIYTTFKDVQMMLKWFFDIYIGFRFSKISVGVFRSYLRLSLAKACFCTQSVNPSLHCNAMVSDRTRLSYLCQLKYLTIVGKTFTSSYCKYFYWQKYNAPISNVLQFWHSVNVANAGKRPVKGLYWFKKLAIESFRTC